MQRRFHQIAASGAAASQSRVRQVRVLLEKAAEGGPVSLPTLGELGGATAYAASHRVLCAAQYGRVLAG